jgi:multisubunit Na+/H+ antiporter MnhB subunit
MKSSRSEVLDSCVRGIVPIIWVFSVFLLFSGHNGPGGGFIAALTGSAALILRFVAAGLPERRTWWQRSNVLLGFGLLIAMAAAMSGWFSSGETFLDMQVFIWDVAVIGKVKVTTALPFDIGVYLVVLGMVLAVLDSLGRDDEPRVESAATAGEGVER